MASTIALEQPLDINLDLDMAADAPKKGLKGGFLNRIRQVGKSLRNTSREDVNTIVMAVGAGIGTKMVIGGAAALLGVAASGVVATLAAAAGTGAAVSLASSAVKHVREGNKLSTFFNRESAKKASISALIAAGTAGYSTVFQSLMGDTITHALGKVADTVLDKAIHAISNTHAFAAARDQAMSESLAHGLAPASTQNFVPFSEPVSSAPAVADTHVAAASHSLSEETPANPALAKAAPVEVASTAKATIGPNANITDDVRSRALAWAKKMNPLAVFKSAAAENVVADNAPAAIPAIPATPDLKVDVSVPANAGEQVVNLKDVPAMSSIPDADPTKVVVRGASGVEVRMPSAPVPADELKTIQGVIHDDVLEAQVRADYAEHFPGDAIPADATIEDMAERLNPSDPKAYLAMASKTGAAELAASDSPANLNPSKMAGSCVANLPSTQEAFDKQDGILPNTCMMTKETMEAGDYVTLRDVAEDKPSVRKGLRVLFTQFSQKTSDFISRTVGEEALQEMAKDKLAAAAPVPQ